jgi:hypothetical protein
MTSPSGVEVGTDAAINDPERLPLIERVVVNFTCAGKIGAMDGR